MQMPCEGAERSVGVLTYANQLTILRMIFVPCFVLLVIYGHPRIATLLFVMAGITDGLDGLIARKFKQKTDLGQFLDPMADKLLLTSAFITLTVSSVPVPLHIPTWLTVLTISRDVVIALSVLIIHLQTGHSLFPPTILGKCTTAAQLCLVGTCMMANFTLVFWSEVYSPLVFATLILTLLSGFHYAYRAVRLISSYQTPEVKNGQSRNQSTGG
jgi:cardiolipin synthase (CMP-forming)